MVFARVQKARDREITVRKLGGEEGMFTTSVIWRMRVMPEGRVDEFEFWSVFDQKIKGNR